MKVRLPTPPKAYDHANEADNRRAVQQAFVDVQSKFEDVNVIQGKRLFMADQVTGQVREIALISGELTVGDPI